MHAAGPKTELSHWSYDAFGRPLAAARGGVALAWAYDAFGRVSTETRDGRPVAASRDADGRLASFSAPGIAQSLAYDAAGRLTTVAVPGQADAYVAYDRSGLESWRLARAGGSDVLRTDLHRDAAGRPLEVAATSSSGAQAGLLRTLDPEGAPLTQVDQSGKGWSFSRDLGTRELLGAQEIGGGSASVATGYDLSGLRSSHSDLLASGAWSTNAAGEANQARGRPVVNDLLGRVTSLDGWNHTYSCDGLLLSSEPASPSEGSRRSVHSYDALGRRVRTVVQAYVGGQWVAFSTTERDFLGRLPLGIETSFADGSAKSWRFMRGPDASGTLEGAGGARGVLAVLKDASSWKAVAADTLGNVLALAGVNGDFTRRTFDPWGNPLTRDAAGNLRASTLSERRADYDALPLAWASQEVDPDTGLTHYHFREYCPSLGGWLSRDPIGLAGGYLNLHSYLGNRPADALDVWGEEVFAQTKNGTLSTHGNSREFLSYLAKADDKSVRELNLSGHAGHQFQGLDPTNDDSKEKLTLRRKKYDSKTDAYEYGIALEGDGLGDLADSMGLEGIRNSEGKVTGVYISKLLAQKLTDVAVVNLLGCNAGGCPPKDCEDVCKKEVTKAKTLAQEISKVLPGALVTGSTVPTERVLLFRRFVTPKWVPFEGCQYKVYLSHINFYVNGELLYHTKSETEFTGAK